MSAKTGMDALKLPSRPTVGGPHTSVVEGLLNRVLHSFCQLDADELKNSATARSPAGEQDMKNLLYLTDPTEAFGEPPDGAYYDIFLGRVVASPAEASKLYHEWADAIRIKKASAPAAPSTP